MMKKTLLFSTLLSLSFVFGCAEFKESIKDWPYSKEEKKTKAKPPAETPKEAADTTPKDSSGTGETVKKDTAPKSTTTTTPAKKPATDSSGSVFGPK